MFILIFVDGSKNKCKEVKSFQNLALKISKLVMVRVH